MSLIYITGVPGVGKTTIQQELTRIGFEAYDIDQPRFGGPTNLVTGESVTLPALEDRTAEWFKHHEWRVSRPAVEELKTQAEGKVVYLCGTTTTEHLIWDLFDEVLYLQIDKEVLRERLASRNGNDFGKSEDEQRIILERFDEAREKLAGLKVVPIDATGNLADTIDLIKRFHKNYIK